jgi:hypothetical protein
MPQLEAEAHVLEEWFRLPESRRMHATDAVAFAFRLLQDRPEMSRDCRSTTTPRITTSSSAGCCRI